MDAAWAALLGAAVGAMGAIIGPWLQQRNQAERDLMKMAAELGMADYKDAVERARAKVGGGSVSPLTMYVFHHAEVLRAIAQDKLTPEEFHRIDAKQVALIQAIRKRDEKLKE